MDDSSTSDSLSTDLFGSSSDSQSQAQCPSDSDSSSSRHPEDDPSPQGLNNRPIPETVDEIESEEEEEEADDDDTEFVDGIWNFEKLSAQDRFHIDTKGTDPYLLSVLQAEAKKIRSNIKAESPDRESSDLSTIVNIFLQPLVPVILRAVNNHLPMGQTAFTKEDVHQFIRALAWLSVYRMMPQCFFDSEMASRM